MEFIKKAELFFIQLTYCLSIDSEPCFVHEKGIYSLMLKPEIFFKLIEDWHIDYPFIPENKIIELRSLMSKENINSRDALKIIENYKKQYWFLDTVTVFEPVIDKLKRTLKRIDKNVTEKEINIELINYQKHLQAKREKIYSDLIKKIQDLLPQQTETEQEQADTSEPKSETNYFCKSMPLNIAREHFKVFADKKSKNGNPFLTVEQLNLFIDRAFCGKNNLPKQKFNQAPKGEKLLIQTVFYEFYNQYCFEYFNTMQCQEDFIKLLTENFEGWDFKNVQENFTPKTKKRL